MSQLITNLNSSVPDITFKTALLKSALIENVLNAFHVNDIVYCHWKSNEHLDASMTGSTDLDILFDETQKERIHDLLTAYDFKIFQPIKQKKYNYIEDYIGVDYSSGQVIHLHSHFRLTLGENYLKSYQLDLGHKILEGRVLDEVFNIYRIHPAFELILLFFRSSFKIRNRDKLKIYLNKNISFPENVVREFKWLKERCTDAEVEKILKQIVPDYQPIYEIVKGKFDRRELLKLSGLIKKQFKDERFFSPLRALSLRWSREFSLKFLRKYSKLTGKPIVLQRTNQRGGLVIAIIGADGSGKSTIIANLRSTFSKKLDVYKIYFGKGGGQVSWYRKMLTVTKFKLVGLKKRVKPADVKHPSSKLPSVSKKKKGLFASVFSCVEALMVANEKLNNYKRMQEAKSKGMLVICDRYPQCQIMGYNDGPMLQHYKKSNNFLLKALAKREAKLYEMFDQHPPDIIFKLIADVDVIAARKPGETSIKKLTEKIEGIKQLKFSPGCKVITVNAGEPLQQVLLTIKKKIWEAYN